LRVSTTRQGESGLGLEAQRVAVANYVASVGGEVVEEYVEVESGKLSSRPVLQAALAKCRRTGATLVIAKLDRLARNVAFVSSLMESRTEFVACDLPFANRLMIHIMAAFAEHEREQIAARTKAALAAAKARGVQLGTHGKVLAVARKAEATKFAQELRLILEPLRGHTLQAISDQLNSLGCPTRGGVKWTPTTVRRVLMRLGLHPASRGPSTPVPALHTPLPIPPNLHHSSGNQTAPCSSQ
jgi:DNA invertase Pin-like site-specific DNA recombinase